MKIALINLPVDNNYGGNLQRFALMKVLQDMGHDVTHLNLRFYYYIPWYKIPFSYAKNMILKYVLGRDIKIKRELYLQQEYENLCAITEPFYQKYVKHTEAITDIKQFKKYLEFDAYFVGSDQVWRKKIANKYLNCMFLDFLPNDTKAKRIAYGVSLGVAENELSNKEIKRLSKLYSQFDAVSVREDSALELFKQYRWNCPKAVHVLDPTMLLQKEDYINLIEDGTTQPSTGNMFCYILDKTDEKSRIIRDKANELHLTPFFLKEQDNASNIEQWLRSFVDAEYVITDSYHGLVFSIIFNKPFCLIRNRFRGNARFDNLLVKTGLVNDVPNYNWERINTLIEEERNKAFNFLYNALVK